MSSSSPTIVVAAGLLWQDGRVLLAQRLASDRHALRWEFPGGKLEPGERAEDCIVREMEEEFGITVSVGAFLGEHTHDYGQHNIRLLAYHLAWTAGALRPTCHAAVAWADASSLLTYDLLAADLPLARLLLAHWPARG